MNDLNIFFLEPAILPLLIPAAGCAFFLRRMTGACQVSAAVFLLLAASGPVLRLSGTAPETVILKEQGAAGTGLPPGRLVTFSGSTAHALADAGAGIREGGVLHLAGSCRESDGSISGSAAALARRGIPVVIHPEAPAAPGKNLLRDLRYPPVAGAGETLLFDLDLAVGGPEKVTAVLREDRTALRKTFEFPRAGNFTVRLRRTFTRAGLHDMTLELNGRPVARPVVTVEPAYKALVISGRKEEAAAVKRLLGAAADVTLWESGADFRNCPLLILTGDGASRLGRTGFGRLSEAVRRGAGLAVFTGKNIPFTESELPEDFSELLPVRYRGRIMNRMPVTALVVIIDTSGSMRGTRIALARETARLALNKLQDHDLAGIVEFHGRRRWAAPLQSAADRLELRRALNRLNAGGGTVILPAVQEAFYALRNADARLKHVLIITDGGVEQGDFEGLLRQMARSDITVSTVLAGSGTSPFLEQLALWGGGRHYTASSRFALPELTFRQSGREDLPPRREGSFPLEIRSRLPLFASLPAGLRTGGVVESGLAPGGEELIRASGMPFIAAKRSGAGTVAVVNSELEGPWVRRLRESRAYTGMLAALLRSLPEPAGMRRFVVRDFSVRRDVHLQMESAEAGKKLFFELTDEKEKPSLFQLEREADGAFHFRRAGLPSRLFRCRISNVPEMTGALAFAIRPFRSPDTAGSRADAAVADSVNLRSSRIDPGTGCRFIGLRSVCGALALILFLTQLLLRRLPRSGKALVLLLLAAAFPLPGGEYAGALREGLLGSSPAASFRRAAALASNAADRRFALSLELEYARRTGEVPKLLDSWKKQPRLSPEQLELLICELEDSGAPNEALALLGKQKLPADGRFVPHLIRLAGKCGRSAGLRNFVRRKMTDDPADLFWFSTAVRLELLSGNREEARRLCRKRIAAENDPERLSAVVSICENAALYDCAFSALDRWDSVSGDDAWPARFRRLDVLIRRGKPDRAAALLKKYACDGSAAPGVMMNLADRCERLGDPETALALYRRAGTEEADIRLAMLLDGLDRRRESFGVWRKIAESSGNEMRSRQAAERSIACAAEEKTLPALCDALLAELRRAPSARLRFFACRALARAGRREELYRLLDDAGERELKFSFLMEERKYAEAAALLAEEIRRTPKRRDDLLRRLTVVAVEAGDGALARSTLERLLQNAADPRAAAEFAAGVYMLLGEPRPAGEMYDRCLKLDDSQIEIFLLRANAWKAAGEKEKAVKFFMENVGKDIPADLFGVMVDGLLNMEAPAPLLRRALQITLRRLEADPGLVFCYRLAEDLAEELGDQKLWRRLQIMQLAAAPERRTLLLRGLYEDALRRNASEEAFYFARLLTDWNEIYTPELYQSLARTLTDNGCYGVAERCIRQADAAENTTRHLFALTQVCMESGRLADSLRICRELMSMEPDSPDLLVRCASILEAQGEYAMAGEENFKALSILAARLGADVNRGKGSRSAAFAKSVRPLIHAFAGQVFLYPERFDARVKKRLAAASPAARQRVWLPLMKQIGELKSLPADDGEETRKKAIPREIFPPEPERFAAGLCLMEPAKAVRQCRMLFDSLPPQRRGAYLLRLTGAFNAEPPPRVTAELMKILETVKIPDVPSAWCFQPRALTLKQACAARMLRQNSRSIPALALTARLRWLSGRSSAARMLAAECCDLFTEAKNISFQDVRALRSLGVVFAARPGEAEKQGAAELSALIGSVENDRRVLGRTPARDLLYAILLEADGNADGALEVLFELWRGGERSVIVSRMMEQLTVRTGRYRAYLATLEKFEPKDPAVKILAARRQVQLYREFGMPDRALARMSILPPLLGKREKLLIERGKLDPKTFAAALSAFLIEQCRTGSYIGLFSDNFGTDGLKGLRRGGAVREDLLPELGRSADGGTLGKVLSYLISGVPVTRRGWAVLFRTRQSLGQREAFSADLRAPQLLPLKAAGGAPLNLQERTLLRKTVLHPRVPLENALICLALLPPDERVSAAFRLAERVVEQSRFLPPLPALESLLRLTDASRRGELFRKLAERSRKEDRPRRLELLWLLRRCAPGLFEDIRKKLPPAFHPMNSELYLLEGKESPEERFINYLTSGGGYPDWEKILTVSGRESELPVFAGKALETAFRRHLIPADEVVRHFSLLAAADASRRAYFLKCAARYDKTPGEASLWRLDAEDDPAVKKVIENDLRRADRFAPARTNGAIPPK
ncbi:MAG: VWA domain-containing protein [Lentisphaeria bacterium]|nr:VWA domain-containing protein [Lentisphaeria bacterium]